MDGEGNDESGKAGSPSSSLRDSILVTVIIFLWFQEAGGWQEGATAPPLPSLPVDEQVSVGGLKDFGCCCSRENR